MITQALPSRSLAVPAPKGAATSLDEAILHTETSSLQLESAHASTHDSYVGLDGFQPAAVDIQRDSVGRDVSESARSLHRRADSTTVTAQNASGKQYDALATLDFAVAALDQALPELHGRDRQDALRARQQLDQGQNLWYADVHLGNALATMNGGALPYIESAETDTVGTDVSWTGGEIYGNLRDTLAYFNEAGRFNGGSLSQVKDALATLRAVRQRVSAE